MEKDYPQQLQSSWIGIVWAVLLVQINAGIREVDYAANRMSL
jgi:hypothetical protein